MDKPEVIKGVIKHMCKALNTKAQVCKVKKGVNIGMQ